MSAQPTVYEGQLDASGTRFTIIVSRFNHLITEPLLSGALDAINRHGGDLAAVQIIRVPGAWEVPIALRQVCTSDKTDAVICLAAVIRGATPHFDYVSAEVSKGIGAISLQSGVPATFGVLTCDTIEQAIERAGTKAGNKGFEAAVAAIEMADLFRKLP
jgi:6,7-dimethyl-8-ribityllumazine synthase